MSDHPFDNEFAITRQQKQQFQTDGFVKLAGFFNAAVVDALLDRIGQLVDAGPRRIDHEVSSIDHRSEQFPLVFDGGAQL